MHLELPDRYKTFSSKANLNSYLQTDAIAKRE